MGQEIESPKIRTRRANDDTAASIPLPDYRPGEPTEYISDIANAIDKVLWVREVRTLRLLYVSGGIEDLRGFARDNVTGSPEEWLHWVHPEDRSQFYLLDRGQLPGEEERKKTFTYRIVRADGTVRWIKDTVSFTRHKNEWRFIGMIQDVTDEKETEDALRRRSDRLLSQRTALEKLLPNKVLASSGLAGAIRKITDIFAASLEVERVSVWRLDAERDCFICIDLSQEGRHSSGKEFKICNVPQYFRSMTEDGIVAATDARRDARTMEFRKAYLEPLGIKSMLDTLIYVRGEIYGIVCAESCRVERTWEDDEKTFALAVSNIISLCLEQWEHEVTAGKVAEAHERLSTVLQATNDAIWDWDIQTNKHWLSSNFGSSFGYRSDVFENGLDSWITFIHRDDRARVSASFLEAVNGQTVNWSAEYRFKRADDTYAHVLDRALIARDDRGKAIRATGSMTDVSELRKSETRFRLATLATHEVIWEWDLKTNGMWWSDTAAALGWNAGNKIDWNFDQCISKVHPSDRKIVQSAIEKAIAAQDRNWSVEHRITLENGRIVTVVNRAYIEYDDDGRPVRMIGSIQDVTERKELEAKFLRAQRLESIGTLASGIAHDLNNILAPILMGAQLVESAVEDPAMRSMVENMRISAERGAGIVRQLLTFAKGIEGVKQTIDVAPLLKDMTKIARQTFPKSISVTMSVADDLWKVRADVTQLHQVLLNLCVNARDAMLAGRLTLTASNYEINAENLLSHPEGTPGQYVRIDVADTGGGMSEEVLANIFSPFFTTKGPQRGTGLGLPTVLGIVKSHKGFIEVKTEVGAGSQFSVFLPAVVSADHVGSGGTQTLSPRGKGQTVLLVDDEEAIRDTTGRTLRENGYRVFTASHGAEALAMLASGSARLDLMVTDVMMPFMDGLALTRAVREFMPEMKIIASSGVCDVSSENRSEMRDQFQFLGVTTLLAKPYGRAELLDAVYQTLHAGELADERL
jgi:PAS domain S-box-containing protein